MSITFRDQRRESLRELTTRKIGELMQGVSAHPITLYEIVAGGPFLFRQRFLREFRGLAVDDHVANMVFKFFCEQVAKRHPAAPPQESAGAMLDAIEVKSPPTAAEIDRAWTHEVFSTEDGRRAHYKDGAGMAGQDHKVILR